MADDVNSPAQKHLFKMTTLYRLIVWKRGSHGGSNIVDTVDSESPAVTEQSAQKILQQDHNLKIDYRLETFKKDGRLDESRFKGQWRWDPKFRQAVLHPYPLD